VDHRNTSQIEDKLESLIKQRLMELALGYKDLTTHDPLRHDPILALFNETR